MVGAVKKGKKLTGADHLHPHRAMAKSHILQEVAEESTLIVASIVTVVTLFVTRSLWFPTSAVEAVLPHPQCAFPLNLNDAGAIEGPWLNGTWQTTGDAVRGALSPEALLAQGKLVAPVPGGDDGLAKKEHLLEGLDALGAESPHGKRMTLAFARLAERYLATWLRIDGVSQGLGKAGLVKEVSLKSMARNEKLAPCVAHVRVVDGRVFFRYGSFLQSARSLRRLNLSIRIIQEAVTRFRLRGLKAEFYLNVCDAPQSYDNSLSAGRSGFAVFSTQLTPGSTDILCPDPLDHDPLERRGSTPLAAEAPAVPWRQRASQAVWRGDRFEFDLKGTNWASSFRLRLHRMSDARPDLLDARVTMWGPADREDAKAMLVRNGVVLGTPLDKAAQRSRYKYVLVVDERVGTREMCAALSGPQAVIRHASGFSQFFEPLLIPGVHYMPTRHSLADLYDVVEWLKVNDASAREMVKSANEIAPAICSPDAQVHFWAVLLVKYAARAMENPDAVFAPRVCEGGRAFVAADWANAKTPPTCNHPSGGRCSDFCVKDKPEMEWVWLSSDAVKDMSEY